MLIMISGPYRGQSKDPKVWKHHLREMNRAAFLVFEKGHVPVIGVNNALPIIEVAGREQYDRLMMPISMALAEKCDAVWRIGGPSKGADQEVAQFLSKGLPVFYSIDEIDENTGA
jgi:hypothetical protein